MDIRVPPFQTNAPLAGGGYSAPFPVWSMKVTAVAPGSNARLLSCVMCDFAGGVVGTRTYTVQTQQARSVGALIFVFQPAGGTGQAAGGRDVSWMELPTAATLCAKLTAKSGTKYAWSEAWPDTSTGVWSLRTGGESGTTTVGPAIELDSSDTTDLTGKYVILVATLGSDGKPCWIIAGAIGAGHTADVTLVDSVELTGTTLSYTTTILHFVNGLFTGLDAGSPVDVAPTEECPPGG